MFTRVTWAALATALHTFIFDILFFYLYSSWKWSIVKFAGDINLVPLPLQVYHLASVRLRDLCVKLDISSDLRGKIWTCFEHSLVHCTDLMKDRHLDQLLLCSIYIISKVRTRRKASHLIKKNVWQLFLNRLRLLRWLAGKCLSGILTPFSNFSIMIFLLGGKCVSDSCCDQRPVQENQAESAREKQTVYSQHFIL